MFTAPAPDFLKSSEPTDTHLVLRHRGCAVSNPGSLGLNTAQSLAQWPRNWPAESVQVWELEQACGCTTLRLTLRSRDRQMYAQPSSYLHWHKGRGPFSSADQCLERQARVPAHVTKAYWRG